MLKVLLFYIFCIFIKGILFNNSNKCCISFVYHFWTFMSLRVVEVIWICNFCYVAGHLCCGDFWNCIVRQYPQITQRFTTMIIAMRIMTAKLKTTKFWPILNPGILHQYHHLQHQAMTNSWMLPWGMHNLKIGF